MVAEELKAKQEHQMSVDGISAKQAGQEKVLQNGALPKKKQVNGDGHFHLNGKPERSKLEWTVPMCVPLPIEILNPDQAFPFLSTTLADLGIDESAVKERVVLVDTKRTQVKGKSGKLKEKEETLLEVLVKAQHPGERRFQEVLYSTESHTDRSFCKSGVDILPWRHTHPAEKELLERTLGLGSDGSKKKKPEEKRDVPCTQ